MKRIWKMQLVVLMAVFVLVGLGVSAQAADRPYEYDFKAGTDTGDKFNGIAPLKQLEITFDKEISELETLKDNIYVREAGQTSKLTIMKDVVIEPQLPAPAIGKQLIVTFKNIDFIDYTKVMDFELVIGKEVLRFDQTDEYILPFTISDILPGFRSVFIDNPDVVGINEKVFKHNPPRDITVHVPKIFIEQIETIHRYEGVVSGYDKDVPKLAGPALTNIDVLANDDVYRLKVKFNDIEHYKRDLGRHDDLKGFTMGQAGIQTVLEEGGETTADKFELKAYDSYGRLVEKRDFALLVIDKETNFKYNGYLPKPDAVFGKPVTLYELMANPKSLETIMRRIPVGELDSSLGVTYKNMISPEATVEDEVQFQMALDNKNIKTIKLTKDIIGDFDIKRDVTIDGEDPDSLTDFAIIGDVVLGDGTEDLKINLKDLTVSDKLTINVGANGRVIAENVTVNGNNINPNPSVIIISGGVNSIHLFNFKAANGIEFNNAAPVRVVITNSAKPNVTLITNNEVVLEGSYGTVNVTATDAKLAMKNSTEIEEFNVDAGAKLTVTYPSWITLPGDKGQGELIGIPEAGDSTKPIIEGINLEYTIGLNLGKVVEFGDFKDLSGEEILIPSDITWEMEDSSKSIFGKDSTVTFYKDSIGTYELKVTGAENNQEEEVILWGEYDGTIYKMILRVAISI